MTGLAERPSRKPPETRSAAKLASTDSIPTRIAMPGSQSHLAARHAAERRQLIATQAAAWRSNGADKEAAARAHAEIVQAFAHRWAHIRRLPPEERAAATATLRAEQAAALSVRTREVAAQVHHRRQAEHLERRHVFAAERTALSGRHREAWARAAAIVQPRLPPEAPRRKRTKPSGPKL